MILDDAGKESTSSQPDNWEMKPAIAIASLQTPIVGLQPRIAGQQTPIVGLQSRIAGQQTPIVGLQSRIAGQQTPIVRLQLQPLIDVRNPYVVRRHVAIVIAPTTIFRLILISSTVQKSPLRSGCLELDLDARRKRNPCG